MDIRVLSLCAISWAPMTYAQAAEPAQLSTNGSTPATTPPSPSVVVKPTLVSQPSPQAFLRGYPVKGWNDHVAGRAVIRCDLLKTGELSGCAVSEEAPPGEGFGAALLKLAPLYRMTPYVVDGATIENKVTLHIDFPIPKQGGEPAGAGTLINHPWWICPDPNKPVQRYYPEAAQRRGVAGLANVECRILTTGKVVACAWVSEDPPGYGFGERAEKLACMTRLTVVVPDGVTPETRIVRMPIRFKIGS